jgi:hypothetical protein
MSPFKDESTIFSICPTPIFETKPGIYPGTFKIAGCIDDSKPERLLIGSSHHLMTVGGRKQPVRIETASHVIAASIVRDFLESKINAIPGQCPGIAWVHGNISVSEFIIKHKDVHDRMKDDQKHWFLKLCKDTDNDWAKYHNHRVVVDEAKFAAKLFGLKPEWLTTEEVSLNFINCPSCSTPNNTANAVCTNCRCILNEDKFKSLKFAS